MSQDKKQGYVNELCNTAKSYDQIGELELACHYYQTAVKFHTMRKLDNAETLCDVWTRLGSVHYIKWLRHRSTQDLSGASDYFKKAMQYSHTPALEAFGLLSMECGNFQEAIKYLNQAAQDGCNRALNYRRIGICYNQIGNDPQTMYFLGKAYSFGDQEAFKLLQKL
jgi:tetratricopeptide (TPR) repeat protein